MTLFMKGNTWIKAWSEQHTWHSLKSSLKSSGSFHTSLLIASRWPARLLNGAGLLKNMLKENNTSFLLLTQHSVHLGSAWEINELFLYTDLNLHYLSLLPTHLVLFQWQLPPLVLWCLSNADNQDDPSISSLSGFCLSNTIRYPS